MVLAEASVEAMAILPEEEEIEEVEVVIPEEVNINSNTSLEMLIDLDSSTSEMAPELNITHLLTTLQRYSANSLMKRNRCSSMIGLMGL